MSEDVPLDTIILVPFEDGFIPACLVESGVGKDLDGRPIFVVMPCLCRSSQKLMGLSVQAEDFKTFVN